MGESRTLKRGCEWLNWHPWGSCSHPSTPSGQTVSQQHLLGPFLSPWNKYDCPSAPHPPCLCSVAFLLWCSTTPPLPLTSPAGFATRGRKWGPPCQCCCLIIAAADPGLGRTQGPLLYCSSPSLWRMTVQGARSAGDSGSSRQVLSSSTCFLSILLPRDNPLSHPAQPGTPHSYSL